MPCSWLLAHLNLSSFSSKHWFDIHSRFQKNIQHFFIFVNRIYQRSFQLKGSDRLCMVVELGKFFRIHLRHIKRFYDV